MLNLIKRLRIKLIVVSMGSLLFVLVIILGSVNALNFIRLVDQADAVLDILEDNSGLLPKLDGLLDHQGEQAYDSPEVPYESRYFSVLFDQNGNAIATNVGQIAAIDQQQAIDLAYTVWSAGQDRGFVGDYRYTVFDEGSGVRISFLDCGRQLDTCRTFLFNSLLISLLGLLAVCILIILLSGRMIRPVAESYEKQKQFITNAGHEIKTPLAIIEADAGLIEMEQGGSEWLQDIQSQVRRLSDLTGDLIYLAQMEEAETQLSRTDFCLSDLAVELSHSFEGLARQHGKQFSINIQPALTLRGDEKSIRQLISILLDNAVKYSTDGGEIRLSLSRQGHALRLSVYNTASGVDKADLPHLFDRFYRADKSRNSQTGGYGIGLSIARAVVSAHRGKITALSPNGDSMEVVVSLPCT